MDICSSKSTASEWCNDDFRLFMNERWSQTLLKMNAFIENLEEKVNLLLLPSLNLRLYLSYIPRGSIAVFRLRCKHCCGTMKIFTLPTLQWKRSCLKACSVNTGSLFWWVQIEETCEVFYMTNLLKQKGEQ